MSDRFGKSAVKSKKAIYTAAGITFLIIILFSSCTHTSPYTEPPFFQTLGKDSEMVITMDAAKSRKVFERTLQKELSGAETITDKAERVSLAAKTTDTEEGPDFYGGIEGDFAKFWINTGLWFSSAWKIKKEEVNYWEEERYGFQLVSPVNGIIIFSSGNMPEVYERSIKNRRIYIPDEIKEKFESAAIALYAAHPDGMNLLASDLSLPFTFDFEEVWATIDPSLQGNIYFSLNGEIRLFEKVQARVFERVLKLLYQEYINDKKLDIIYDKEKIEDSNFSVLIDELIIDEELLYNLIDLAAEDVRVTQ
ncbi:MAG: hypothetical protein K9K80_01215 [Spirochaetia bacterium]|nr:hypothetical protein [Spirochaetia bacterium]